MGYRDDKTWPDRKPSELGRPRGRGDSLVDSGTRRSPVVSNRSAALAFMEGALEGWPLHQLVTWIDQCLIRPGRLMTRYPFPRIFINEPDVGVISYGPPGNSDAPSTFLPHAKAAELMSWSRKKVAAALEGMLRASPDDRFVQAALYDGRVSRTTGHNGQRGWNVMLTEAHSLSEQILALFAADLLDHREDYEQHLVVCESCEVIDFWPERLSRRGCPAHPQAVVSGSVRRITLSR